MQITQILSQKTLLHIQVLITVTRGSRSCDTFRMSCFGCPSCDVNIYTSMTITVYDDVGEWNLKCCHTITSHWSIIVSFKLLEWWSLPYIHRSCIVLWAFNDLYVLLATAFMLIALRVTLLFHSVTIEEYALK